MNNITLTELEEQQDINPTDKFFIDYLNSGLGDLRREERIRNTNRQLAQTYHLSPPPDSVRYTLLRSRFGAYGNRQGIMKPKPTGGKESIMIPRNRFKVNPSGRGMMLPMYANPRLTGDRKFHSFMPSETDFQRYLRMLNTTQRYDDQIRKVVQRVPRLEDLEQRTRKYLLDIGQPYRYSEIEDDSMYRGDRVRTGQVFVDGKDMRTYPLN